MKTLLALLLSACGLLAQERFVAVTLPTTPNVTEQYRQTNNVTVAPGETFQLVSLFGSGRRNELS